MNPTIPFEQRFPLSSKKFTKKMLNEIVWGFFSSIFISLVPALIFIFISFGNINTPIPGVSYFVGIFVFSFVAIFILRTIFYIWYWKRYIATYFYDAGESFVTIKKGVFTPSEIHVQYQKIQDVYVDQDVWDRILGIYDVHIASATVSSGIEAHIDGVDHGVAEALKQLLLSSIKSGGQTTSPTDGVVQAQAQTVSFHSTQEISQDIYPISGAWLFQKAITAFFTSLFPVIVIIFISFNGSDDQSQFFMIATAAYVVVWLFQVITNVLWKNTYKFKFMPDYLFVHEGVISVEEKHVPYNTIQDVVVSQGFFERMFGLGTVSIQNAVANQSAQGNSNGIVIPGQPIAKAQELSNLIRDILASQRGNSSGL